MSLRKSAFSGGSGETGAQPELKPGVSVCLCFVRTKLLIGAALLNEFRVAAVGHDTPLFKHNNSVSPGNCRGFVGNKKYRPVFAILFQPLHEKRRGKAVESTRDFIQYQDSGLLQQSPRQRDSLLFSSRKFSS